MGLLKNYYAWKTLNVFLPSPSSSRSTRDCFRTLYRQLRGLPLVKTAIPLTARSQRRQAPGEWCSRRNDVYPELHSEQFIEFVEGGPARALPGRKQYCQCPNSGVHAATFGDCSCRPE